jgi:putative iron-regulated protein
METRHLQGQFRIKPDLRRLRSFWEWWVACFSLLPLICFFPHRAFGSAPAADADLLKLKQAVLAEYAEIAGASYQDSLTSAKKLQSAVNVLLANPSEQTLNSAREAWLSAHHVYSFTETFRFYNGPIDQVEALVNSWPIDPSYIDYVVGVPDGGIVNGVSSYPELSRSLLISLNAKDGKENISTGFHAIEFLLWGQAPDGRGPGDRSWRDYTDGAPNVDRRRVYLRIVTDLLIDHLQTVARAWADGDKGDYRAKFLALPPDTALADILTGMGSLSGPELSGERLTTAYETKERDEQQDCFSDNTCRDLTADAVGIQNVFLGHYTASDGHEIAGPGIRDLLLRLDPDFAAKLTAQVAAAVAAVQNIPPPLDQAIVGTDSSPSRIAVKNAINATQIQSNMMAQAAKVLSIQLNL